MVTCSTCSECRSRTRQALRPRARAAVVTVPGLTKPTRAALEKHAASRYADPKRVGEDNAKKTIEAVLRVAAECGITVSVEKIKSTKVNSRGPSLKDRIREHLSEGHDIDFIAEMENITPSRARRLVAEMGEST